MLNLVHYWYVVQLGFRMSKKNYNYVVKKTAKSVFFRKWDQKDFACHLIKWKIWFVREVLQFYFMVEVISLFILKTNWTKTICQRILEVKKAKNIFFVFLSMNSYRYTCNYVIYFWWKWLFNTELSEVLGQAQIIESLKRKWKATLNVTVLNEVWTIQS